MRIFYSLLLLCFSQFVLADWKVQGIRMACGDDFKVLSHNLINKEPKEELYEDIDGSWLVFRAQEKELECSLNGLTIKSKVTGKKSSARGACGSAKGASLSLTINGLEILKNSLMNNECYQSIDKIEISPQKITICGHQGNGKAQECFDSSWENISDMQLPLSPFPISKLKNQE
ncbi:MAG: hypothetical protein HWE18_09950 [Gammaproteobacteria bacterium]|nr:hypothetical protein [Gammaproteobacteria bacterium]